MSLLTKYSIFHFFRNKELNQFYLAIFIKTMGESLINIFVPIYLYSKGFPIYQILFFYFLVSLYFVIFSYQGAKIVAKIGDKHSMLWSSPFLVVYYLGLIFIKSSPILFFILPLLLSFRMILFNYGHHLNFIHYSRSEKRGKELAFIGTLTLLATMTAPFIGGLLASIDFSIVFISSSVLILLGATPLLLSKDKFRKLNFDHKFLFKDIISRKNIGNFISFSGYAIEAVISRVLWPIFIITVVGSIEKTGLLVSASAIISLLVFNIMGQLTDKVDKNKLMNIGTVLFFFGWIGRIFANTANKILLINSYKNFSGKILFIPWEAHSYDLAKRSDPFEFVVSREIIFNFIRVLIFPFIILIFWTDFHPFTISFVIAAIFSLGYPFINK